MAAVCCYGVVKQLSLRIFGAHVHRLLPDSLLQDLMTFTTKAEEEKLMATSKQVRPTWCWKGRSVQTLWCAESKANGFVCLNNAAEQKEQRLQTLFSPAPNTKLNNTHIDQRGLSSLWPLLMMQMFKCLNMFKLYFFWLIWVLISYLILITWQKKTKP